MDETDNALLMKLEARVRRLELLLWDLAACHMSSPGLTYAEHQAAQEICTKIPRPKDEEA